MQLLVLSEGKLTDTPFYDYNKSLLYKNIYVKNNHRMFEHKNKIALNKTQVSHLSCSNKINSSTPPPYHNKMKSE